MLLFWHSRFIIWRVGFWNIWWKSRRMRAFGRVSALCLTNEWRSIMGWSREALSCAMGASSPWAMRIWKHRNGNMVSHAHTASPQNQKKRESEQELGNGSLRPGASSVDLTRAEEILLDVRIVVIREKINRFQTQFSWWLKENIKSWLVLFVTTVLLYQLYNKFN